MDATEYRDELKRHLDAASATVSGRLARIREVAGELADGVTIEVFLGDDAEGPLDIWAQFDGPDAFSLDRRLGDERMLFGVVWGEYGWEPEVPPRPRGWTRDEFEQQVLDTVTEWLEPLVPAGASRLRWEVVAHDGVLDPRPLGPHGDARHD